MTATNTRSARKTPVFAASALAAATVLAFGAPRAAWADAPPASSGRTSALSWVRLPGADGCIGAPALASAIEARLHRRVFVPPADAELSIEGTVAYRADTKRFRAIFRVADREGHVLGERIVEESVPSCDKLDDRFAFVLSVLIDPDAALGAAPTEPETALPPPVTPATPAPAPAPVAIAPEAPKPAPPESPTWRWLVAADFGPSAGLVPDVGFVVSGGVLIAPPHWPALRARGSSFLPTSRRVEGDALAQIGLVTGEVGICPLEVRRAPFGITFCLDGLLGELSAHGEGFPDSRGYGTLLGGVTLDAVAELDVTRNVVLTLSPSFVVPLTRARLSYDDASGNRRTIFEVAPVAGSIALGLAAGSR